MPYDGVACGCRCREEAMEALERPPCFREHDPALTDNQSLGIHQSRFRLIPIGVRQYSAESR